MPREDWTWGDAGNQHRGDWIALVGAREHERHVRELQLGQRAMGQCLGSDGLNDRDWLLWSLLMRPGDGQGPDGAYRESETDCLEHLSLPMPAIGPSMGSILE
jgi:hypothetical protein